MAAAEAAEMLTEFSGFNGFGQFGSSHPQKVHTFTEFSTDSFALTETSHIACSWSYIALATEKRIWLRGFLSEEPNAMLCVTAEDSIQAISASDRFCLALLKNGKVYKLAPKLDATLQEVKFDAEVPAMPVPPQKRSIFGECKSVDEPLRITHIASSTHIAVAVSSENAAFSIPSQIHQFPKQFRTKQLVCGFEHALLLSGNGDIYTWGNGLRGQLGLEVVRMEEKPTLLDALAGIKITYIAAGGWSSAAISAFGDLYTWGINHSGQLGLRVIRLDVDLKGATVYPLPQLVDLPQCCKADQIAPTDGDDAAQNAVAVEDERQCEAQRVFAGARHMLLQMSCGSLFATGWNVHGQLGLRSDREEYDQFTRIESAACGRGVHNLDVICGAWNTIIRKNGKEH